MMFYKVRDQGKTEQEDEEYRGAKGLSKDSKEVIGPRGFQAEGTARVRPWGGRCLVSAESQGHHWIEPGSEGGRVLVVGGAA